MISLYAGGIFLDGLLKTYRKVGCIIKRSISGGLFGIAKSLMIELD